MFPFLWTISCFLPQTESTNHQVWKHLSPNQFSWHIPFWGLPDCGALRHPSWSNASAHSTTQVPVQHQLGLIIKITAVLVDVIGHDVCNWLKTLGNFTHAAFVSKQKEEESRTDHQHGPYTPTFVAVVFLTLCCEYVQYYFLFVMLC